MGFGQDNFILNVSRPIRVGYARALARLSGSDVAARRVMNLAKRFSKAFRKPRRVKRNYAAITLEERDIRSGAYKKYMPGGAAQWHQRGAFQFFFLKRMGLQARCWLWPNSRRLSSDSLFERRELLRRRLQ